MTVAAERTDVDWWASREENVYAHRKRLCFIVDGVEARRVARKLEPGDVRVLDVGCGTGTMITLPLASLGYRVTGLDVHGPSVDAASRLNPYANATFRQGEPATLAAAGERYDVVVASEVLEHQADPLAFLRALRGLLAPAGILIMTTPNGYGWFELEQWLWDDLGLAGLVQRWERGWRRCVQAVKAPIKWAIGWTPRPLPPLPPWKAVPSTVNTESPHLQRFRWRRLTNLLALAGVRILRDGKSCLFCGEIAHHYLKNRRLFIAWNARIATILPRALTAGWYVVCEIDPARPRLLCLADSALIAQAPAALTARFGVPPASLVSFRDLRQRPALAFRLPLRQFDAALALLADVGAPLYRDFILAYLFLLRAGRKGLCDVQGRELTVGLREGLRALGRCLHDLAAFPAVYGLGRWRAGRLMRGSARREAGRPVTRRVAYLRANLWQESRAGGSVAHTAGVLAGLKAFGVRAAYVGTADFPPARRLGLEVAVVPAELPSMRNLPDLPFVAYSHAFGRRCLALFRTHPPDFIYQRYSVLNDAGAWLADRLRRPFVLEYNGSEVWIARHWSTPLMFEGLATRIEEANLRRADLIVVVSKALRDEVVSRGIPTDRVLVNPNAVDPGRYHPAIDGGPIRFRLGLSERFVVGFIGTFGPWHGAEVLARAVRLVAERLPAAHFLFVGDGSGMPAVREIIGRDGMRDRTTFTGLVPQDDAPAHLAACDLLASPHVGNPDGTPFFGSPTKLFEYMAMGKGIVASDLDQIGELLSHGQTAWLVPPGEPAALADGILRLAGDPTLRARLGEAARLTVERHHTWGAHVGRILEALVARDLVPTDILTGRDQARPVCAA